MFQREVQEKEIAKLEKEIDKLLNSDLEPDKLNSLLDELEEKLSNKYNGLRIVE